MTDALLGRLVDGRYRVMSRIARGGMATVYEARDERLGRDVALKVMHPDLADDDEFVQRFIAEARAAASLSRDRSIVTVFDQGATDGVVWLALELVRDRTLRTLIVERGRLDPRTALAIIDPVLTALAAAHEAGIVHRDVKPENVLVGDDGHVQVADFGLAHAVTTAPQAARGAATRGMLLGTVAYISPEQALGSPATQASDVYAAGVLLFELLTGHPPPHLPRRPGSRRSARSCGRHCRGSCACAAVRPGTLRRRRTAPARPVPSLAAPACRPRAGYPAPATTGPGRPRPRACAPRRSPVSYTHLTLPTN